MKSIIDQVISKETAKLFYKENYTYPVEYIWVGDKLISFGLLSGEKEYYLAPSLCMVLKFLREERGIFIDTTPFSKKSWMSEIKLIENNRVIVTGEVILGKSWEEVVEKQIQKIYEDE